MTSTNRFQPFSLKQISIANYYAVELLESEGKKQPSQREIDHVESTLKAIKRSKKHQQFNCRNQLHKSKGSVMLVEEQPLLAYVHSQLLKNLGFEVEHHWRWNPVEQKKVYFYDLIILSHPANTLLILKLKQYFENHHRFPLTVVLADQISRESKEKLIKAGAGIVMNKYFLSQNLTKSLDQIDFFQKNKEVSHINTCETNRRRNDD